MLISFTGAQCTGKTTLLKECMSMSHEGEDFFQWNFVNEVTRKVKRNGFSINEQGNNATQLHILSEHLINHTQSVGNTMLDRCILDGYIYSCYLASRGIVDEWVCEYAGNLMNELVGRLDHIFYTQPEDIQLIDDGERSLDHDFRQGIIDRYEELFAQKYFWYNKIVRLYGDEQERMLTILQTINEHDNSNIRQLQNI